MGRPLFSIIVVSYNASELIKDTINSILMQTFDDYEIVVKDACSEDDTIEQIPVDSRIRLYKSTDSGIYDGMNQAITMADGQFLHFLNCGDVFYSDDVLAKIAVMIEEKGIVDGIIYGDSMMKNGLRKQPSVVTPFFLYRTPMCHQSMFFSKTVFLENGLYDLNYKIVADYDCTLKAFRSGVSFFYIHIPVCYYLGGGVSESETGVKIKKNEYKEIHREYFSLWERIEFETLLLLSMRRLRFWMNSDKSPRLLREFYNKAVYRVNK